ncbi:MAG: peptidase domain-containing ABC transporter [Chitinophagia bacterium]|jgi:ATP-binding cassette subfamily B protein
MAGLEHVSLGRSIRRFFEVIRLEKREVSAIYFFAILSGLIQLTLPLGIQAIINFAQAAAGQGKLPASMWLLILLVVLGVFAAGIMQISQMRVVEKIQQRIFTRYAFEFTYTIPRLKTSATENYYLPELVNRFFDTVSLQKALSKLLIDIPLAVIQILFGLILLSFYNPVFIILGLLLLTVLYVVLYYTSKPGLEASLRESNYKYSVAGWLEELARAFKSFKVAGNHNLHLKKTDELLEGYLKARTEHFYVLKFQYWSLIFFKLLITAAMLIIGAVLLIGQELNLGQFIAAEIVIITVLAAVEKLILSLDKAYDLLTSLEKLTKVTEKEIEKGGSLIFEPGNDGVAIEMNDLSFGFREDQKILKNIELNIQPGQKLAILGDAGSGKSILLDLMTGSLEQQEGNLLINGIPIRNHQLESYRKHIGVFYHEQDIFNGTLMENLTMGDSSINTKELMELVEVVGLNSFVKSLPEGFDTMLEPTGKGLSTIIAKKILLLRAFASRPELLLLDEPFELAGGEDCQKIESYLMQLKNTTVVVVTANLDFAKQSDLVIIMESGQILHSGKPSEILKKVGKA